MNKKKLKKSFYKSYKELKNAFPMILGTILLLSLISTLVPKSFYLQTFKNSVLIDSFIGSLVGSISAGNPLSSYIFAGEMLNFGVGLIAVTSFIVSWVTVGVIQLPAEIHILGKKFAILRNVTSFLLSILVAIITVIITEVIL